MKITLAKKNLRRVEIRARQAEHTSLTFRSTDRRFTNLLRTAAAVLFNFVTFDALESTAFNLVPYTTVSLWKISGGTCWDAQYRNVFGYEVTSHHGAYYSLLVTFLPEDFLDPATISTAML